MPLVILSILVQVAFVVHVFRTGRDSTWIWIIVILPIAGPLAYFLVEVVPAWRRRARRARKRWETVTVPDGEIDQTADARPLPDSLEAAVRRAEELSAEGFFADAAAAYERCLRGPHAHHPQLLHGLALALFEQQDFRKARETLDALIAHNPDYRDSDAHLLYARALEKLGEIPAALHEYEALQSYYPGPEAAFDYAILLKSQGETERAQALFAGIVKTAESSGRYNQSAYRELIDRAKLEC